MPDETPNRNAVTRIDSPLQAAGNALTGAPQQGLQTANGVRSLALGLWLEQQAKNVAAAVPFNVRRVRP